MTRTIRPATAADAEACAAIYSPYVEDTHITFETEVPSSTEMAARIVEATRQHAWLVLEEDGMVTGYAYGGTFHPRSSYQWACEASVYMDTSRRSSGGGSELYRALLEALRGRGFRRVIGGITQPNEASNRLHEKFGFELVGTYTKIGWKNGSWHDVSWYELDLYPDDARTDEPEALR